jgi:hypothetical protein
MQSGQQYEFSANQNQLIGYLSRRMNVVGIFLILIGLGVAVLAVISLLPLLGNVPELPSQVPPEMLDAFRRYEQYARGNREPLYYGSLAGGLQALILVISGVYVRRSANSFRRIVNSEGRDISHLMDALVSLRGLFGILYSLLLLALMLAMGLVAVRITSQMG